jgi:transforming growth factor-beta-induced protein
MKTKEFFKTMKSRFNLIPIFILALGLVVTTSCNDDDDDMMPKDVEKSIADVAAENGSFTILLQAAQKAGLADYLNTQ